MCFTVAPMARAGGGDITGNVLGQGFTSTSPCTHVHGAYGAPTAAYGAPTGAIGGATNGRRARTNDPTVRQPLRDTHENFTAALPTTH